MSEKRRLQLYILLITAILVIAVFLCIASPVHAASSQTAKEFKDMNGVTWIYEVLPEGGASIMGCDRIPENGLLVLPFQVEDGDEVYDVTEIGMGAFHGSFDMGVQFDQLLQHLVIPDTVKKIGASAFSGDTKLETVRLSQNLERIESNAFTSCPIKEIQFPDSVSFIGGGAFMHTDLTSVTIPASADFVMSNGAFWECPDLTEFNVPETNPNYIAVGGVIYSQDRKALVAYPCGRDDPAYTVPEGVTTLNETAFFHSEIQEVLLPGTLTTIGASAFYGCDKLTSIHVPEGVQKLGQACFGYCGNLTDVELPDTLTSIGSHAFRSCQSLQNLTIPESVTEIKEYAFFEMTVADSLAIPENVTKIDYATFQYMGNLEEIYLPEGITSIAYDAFEGHSLNLKIFSTSDVARAFAEEHGITFVEGTKEDFEAAVIARKAGPEHVHVLEHKMAIEATCTYSGRVDHYYCSACKKSFADAQATQELDEVYLPRLPHDLKHVPAKAATYEEEGNIEYWVCQNENCGLIFSDESARTQLTKPETVIPVRVKPDDPDDPPVGPDDPPYVVVQPVEQTITGTGSYTRSIGSHFQLDARAMTELSYQSSNTKVASVSSDGVVTIKGYGTCTITVTAAATDQYQKAVRRITVKGILARPVLKAVNKPGKKIKLSWNKVQKTRGYLLYVKLPGEKKYRLAVSKPAKVKSVTHSGLTKGKKYSYKLRAYMKVGRKTVYSRYSRTVTVKVKK